jgi:hypothetical protein
MARNLHRGAFRTAIAYVFVVMGGTAFLILLRIALGGSWSFDLHGYIHPGFRATFISGATYFLRIFFSLLVLIWLFTGTVLYLCALALNKLSASPVVSKLILALLSMFISARILIYLAPVPFPSLPALYLMMMVAGALGATFGFFLASYARSESFQVAPLGWGYRAAAGAWLLTLCLGYAHLAYDVHKVNSVKDPPLDFVFVKWAPTEGEVREEKVNSMFPALKDSEIQELRSAGITGILKAHGTETTFVGPARSRFVIIMSRGTNETIDLPKPASGNIIYLQTQKGWKAFPSSTATVSRTVRLTFSGSNPHQTYPSTNVHTDMGLGHSRGAVGEPAFNWIPEEFQAPLPSLPDRPTGTASSSP